MGDFDAASMRQRESRIAAGDGGRLVAGDMLGEDLFRIQLLSATSGGARF